jgi:NADH dehydrogenase
VGNPLPGSWGFQTHLNGQVTVLPTLQTPLDGDVYVVGDLSGFKDAEKPLQWIAPVAIQQGVHAGKNILRQISGRHPLPFKYKDRGTMVSIGRNSAVAYTLGYSFKGFFAWLLWLGVHLFNLIGFHNRLIVMINWAWDYFFFERLVRLILPRTK